MVADSTTIRFKHNAQLGQYDLGSPRVSHRLAPAIEDTVTFSHQTAAEAAPQFSGWRTWANSGLIALTLATGFSPLASCKKDPIVNVITDGQLLNSVVKNSGILTHTNTPQAGYTFYLTMDVKDAKSAEKYAGQPAMVTVPVTTWRTGDKTTKTEKSPVELKMVDGKFVLVSPIPLTKGGSGSVPSGARLLVGEGQPDQEEFLLDDLAKNGQLISPDDAQTYFNAPFELNDFSGVTKALFEASNNVYGDTSIDYRVAGYNSTQLKNYVQHELTARKVPEARVTKLVGMLDNATFKQRTQNGNNDLMATGIFWAAEDKTDGVYNALTGQSSTKHRLVFVDALPDNAKMTTRFVDGFWEVAIRNNAYPKSSPIRLSYVVTNNEWPDVNANKGNLYSQNIEDMLEDLQYARDLATLPDAEAQALFEEKNPTSQAYNVAQLDLLGSGEDMKADLPTAQQKYLRGKNALYANQGSYEATTASGNTTVSATVSASVTPTMRQRLIDLVGMKDSDIPTTWNPNDLTFYNAAKMAIFQKHKEYAGAVAARFKLDPQAD